MSSEVEIRDKILSSKLPSKGFSDTLEKSFIEIILDCVRAELATKGDRDWLIDADPYKNDRKRTCRLTEVEPESRKAASALRKSGIRFGDVVQVVLPCSAYYYFPVFGAWLIGAAVSLSDPGLPGEVLLKQLEETSGKIIFCFQDSVKNFVGNTSVEIVVIPDGENKDQEVLDLPNVISWEKFLVRGDASDPSIDGRSSHSYNDTAVIFWSSGTTGRPKGILHTQRYLVHTLQKSRFTPQALLQTTCFYHTGGFFCPLDGGLYNGYKIPYLNPNRGITTDAILRASHEHKPNVLMVGSHHALQLGCASVQKDLDLSSVVILAPMGSAVHAGLKDELKRHFPNMMDGILGFYGMSEIGTIARSFSPTSLGVVTPGVQVKIVDPVSGELQGPNQVGEIVAKNLTMLQGYLNRPDETKKFFRDDGFVRTGDLGYYDDKGILYYHDRLKDLIKYNNIHIYPNAIEEVLYQHEDVVEAGVFGRPDPLVQELVTAVVVKKEGSNITEDELIEYVNQRVDQYKKIRGGLRFVDSIPRNPQGKVLKPQLKKLFE